MVRIVARAPASVGNLGPGFDVVGAALTLWNTFEVEPGATGIEARGYGREVLSDPERNLFLKAFREAFRRQGLEPPPVRLRQVAHIPLQSGLGSSASAIVAGLGVASALLPEPLTPTAILELASELEGHADNVTAAYLGGVTLAVPDAPGRAVRLPPPRLAAVVYHPGTTLSTTEARRLLPPAYTRDDVVANLGHLGLLVYALLGDAAELLPTATRDRLHEPYRRPAIPAADELVRAGESAGALSVVVCGSGPSLLALTPPARSAAVAEALEATGAAHGLHGRAFTLAFAADGLKVETRRAGTGREGRDAGA
jgi:homoserine kinase